MRPNFFILLFLLLSAYAVFSQDPAVRVYSKDNGLPSNEVYHVLQDSRGYIWLATNYGVSRFDGYQFVNFNKQHGLPDNTVFEIYEDYKGRIWFIPFNCQLSYFENGKIVPYKYNYLIKKAFTRISPNPVKQSFIVTKDGRVAIGTVRAGIIEISEDGKFSQKYSMEKPISNVVSDRRKIWCTIKYYDDKPILADNFGKDNPYVKIIKNNKIDTVFITNQFPEFLGKETCIHIDNGNLLYARENILSEIKNNKVVHQRIFKSRIIWLSSFDEYIIVSVYKNGIYFLPKNNFNDAPVFHFFKNQIITSLARDHEGALWFSSYIDGVFYKPSLNFLMLSNDLGIADARVISMLALPCDDILFGTNRGDVILNRKDTFQKIKVDTTDYSEIKTLLLSKDSEIVFVGTSNFLYQLNLHNLKCEKVKLLYEKLNNHNERKFSLPGIQEIIYSKTRDEYLIGASGSVISFSSYPKTSTILYSRNSQHIRVSCIYESFDGRVWCGSVNGLWLFENKKLEFIGDMNVHLSNRITDILSCGNDSVIWLATRGNGIVIYNIFSEKIETITSENGLPDNNVNHLYFDGVQIYAGTDKGLSIFNPVKKDGLFSYKIFGLHNGLPSNEILGILCDKKYAYISTPEGLCTIEKQNLKRNTIAPRVIIQSVLINSRDTILLKTYELDYYKNYISVGFAGLTFRKAGQTKFQYKMDGLDSTWHSTTNNYVHYTTLPPGVYTFRVKAFNEDGISSIENAEISFVINSPFWETWWFRILILFLVASVIFIVFAIIYRIKLKEEKKLSLLKHAELEKRNQLETDLNKYMQMALSKQMNPHFIFNSLNSIQRYILENDRIKSNHYLSQFASLMRIVLNNSSSPLITFRKEIEALSLYLELECLRCNNRFEYKIEVMDELILDYKIPPLLIQPYVENSIWHGLMNVEKNGQIIISLQKNDSVISCIIDDNGIGRKKCLEKKADSQKKHISLGSTITETRLDILNSLYGIDMRITYDDKEDNLGNSLGTQVRIFIPVIN